MKYIPLILIASSSAAFLGILFGMFLFKGNSSESGDSQHQQEPAKIDNSVQWIYGGFNGSKTASIGDVIKDLKLGQKDMSYSWAISESQAVSLLGSKSKTEPDLLACFFVTTKSGEIVGGKFEWISVSRKTRQFTNVFDHYNGWTLDNVPGTTKAYFCIAHPKNGRRTNFIEATWNR